MQQLFDEDDAFGSMDACPCPRPRFPYPYVPVVCHRRVDDVDPAWSSTLIFVLILSTFTTWLSPLLGLWLKPSLRRLLRWRRHRRCFRWWRVRRGIAGSRPRRFHDTPAQQLVVLFTPRAHKTPMSSGVQNIVFASSPIAVWTPSVAQSGLSTRAACIPYSAHWSRLIAVLPGRRRCLMRTQCCAAPSRGILVV